MTVSYSTPLHNKFRGLALAQFNCRVIQSTSDEAPGLLAYVAHSLEAHHSPDLFHVQHELDQRGHLNKKVRFRSERTLLPLHQPLF
jgi:hypothetical protein